MSKNDTENTRPQNPYRWTVMVYLAGDNNLAEESIYALTEMQKVGTVDGELAIVAQLDSGTHENTRIKIDKNVEPGSLVAALNKARHERHKRGRKTESDPKREFNYFDILRSFVDSAIDSCPADHYMLVLSGHGHGTLGAFLDKQNGDEVDGLSIPALGGIVKYIEKKFER